MSVEQKSIITATFAEQSERYLADLSVRKRRPVSQATLHAFRGSIKCVLPFLAATPLDAITNSVMKDVVNQLVAQDYAPKTILEAVNIVKSVVASLLDGNGNVVIERTWNSAVIDLPDLGKQAQPTVSVEDVERCMKDARTYQEQLMYAIAAGSAMRISEILAINVGGPNDQTRWIESDSTIYVKSSVYQGKVQLRLKTKHSYRIVDMDTRLSAQIAAYVAKYSIQPGAPLFQAKGGARISLTAVQERLAKHHIEGFHCFRRFRISWMREVGVPEDILRFWVGHAGQGITDRYSKLAENVELRRQWAQRAGLSFSLSRLGHPAPRPAKPAKPTKSVKLSRDCPCCTCGSSSQPFGLA